MLSTGQLVVVALLAGTANVFFATAYQVCLPSLVTAAELVAGNARLQGGASVAAIAGRGFAGLAAQAVGAVAALLFNAASFLVSALCLLRIRPTGPSPQPTRRTGGVRTETWPGICFVARDPYLRPLTIYAAIANLAYTGNLALVVIFLVRVVGLSSAAAGLLMATGGIGGLFGLLIPLTERGPRLACYLIGSALIAGGLVVANVIAASFRQEYCPPSMLGRVTASMRFLAFGMIPLGALLAGALGTALGVRDGLWLVLVIFAASSLVLLNPRIRTARNLPHAPARTERKSAVSSPLRSPKMS